VIANAVVFLITRYTAVGPILANLMALRPDPLLTLRQPWTPITYMFVHANFMHIFFNMLVLFFFGPRLEMRLGGARFIRLYFLSGFAGAVLSMAFLLGPPVPIIGASGAVYGVLMGFAILWPRDAIYIWGIVPVQARWLVGVMTAMTVFLGFGGGQDGVAHFAHLGGFLGGYLYMRRMERNAPHRKFKEQAYAADKRRPGRDGEDIRRWANIQLEGLHEVNRDEVERLQAKIKELGVATLTLEERAFMNRFSRQ
jgi:membrane associated rhomboid family serine protease